MQKAKVSIDGSSTVLDGYDIQKTWNGWDVIMLDESNLREWLASIGCEYISKDDNGTIEADYDGSRIEFAPTLQGRLWLYDMQGYSFILAGETC